MKALPTNAIPYRRTPEFNEGSVPKGLLRSHRTNPGVWGKIVVLEGNLSYRVLEPEFAEHRLDPEHHGIVEPTVRHEVRPQGSVRFYVQFYRINEWT